MADLDLETEMTKIERLFDKEGRVDEIKEIRSLDPQQLNDKLLALAKHHEEIVSSQKNDGDLKAAKANARVLGATYRDQLKFNAKKSRFIALLMKDQGLE